MKNGASRLDFTLTHLFLMIMSSSRKHGMHRSAKLQTPPNAVDLLRSCEGL